jgi:heme-degrading monooxygenase HmoA
MIARTWHATAAPENADAYSGHFASEVVPHLKDIAGHRGALLLRRPVGDLVEFVAITLWDSMEAVRQFAGARPDAAKVEPQATAVLARFDEFVTHYEVAGGFTRDYDIDGPALSPSPGR